MILESAQLVSTTIQVMLDKRVAELYKPTHRNHPCTIWARTAPLNLQYLMHLGLGLCGEYTKRYGKYHKSGDILVSCIPYLDELKFPEEGMTKPALAMPDEYKCADPVESYRNYYRGDKRSIATWKTEIPFWWE